MKTIILVLFSLASFTAISQSEITIIEDDEPGIPFTYSIQVLELGTLKPIPGAKVFTYQTNHVGDYESSRPQDARINGTLITDSKGTGSVKTIFPRGYNNSDRGEHIHYKVEAVGYESSSPTLMFLEYYDKKYDWKNPEPKRAYLQELEYEQSGKRTGKVILYLRSK